MMRMIVMGKSKETERHKVAIGCKAQRKVWREPVDSATKFGPNRSTHTQH